MEQKEDVKPSEEQVAKAVAFWSAKFGNYQVDIVGRGDSPEDPRNARVAEGQVLVNATACVLTAPALQARQRQFGEALAEVLRAEIIPGWCGFLHVGVDYWPGGPLRTALERMGIGPKEPLFPTKVDMWLNADGTVEVRDGYQAPFTRL